MENLPNELYHACRQNATMNAAAINLISAPKRVYCFSPLSFRLPLSFHAVLDTPYGRKFNRRGGGVRSGGGFCDFARFFGAAAGKISQKANFARFFGAAAVICDRQSRHTGFARFWRQRQQAIRQCRHVMKYHTHISFREIYLNKVVV